VTRKRTGAGSAKAFSPNRPLIERYATTYQLKAENLAAVLSDFGPLPEAEQERLIRCLILAFGQYQFAAKTKERTTPSDQRNQLNAIERTAKTLLHQLGETGVNIWLGTAGVVTADRDEAPVNAELIRAQKSVADAVSAIKDLRARAKTAAHAASKRIAPGRGGSRHRHGAKGQLIKDAIAIYSHMRAQHPDGGPMPRFVRAVGKLCGDCVQDSEIREVWRVRKSKQKKS
jgi:hypothetical protein